MGCRIREDKGGGVFMRGCPQGRGIYGKGMLAVGGMRMACRVREDKGGGVGPALAGDAADGEREGEDGSPPSRGQGREYSFDSY